MATLTVTRPGLTGAVIPLVAATVSGDKFPNTGVEKLVVLNSSGGSINVTILRKANCDQGFHHDDVVAVAAAARKEIGPFSPSEFGGMVDVTYSSVTTVTVGVTG